MRSAWLKILTAVHPITTDVHTGQAANGAVGANDSTTPTIVTNSMGGTGRATKYLGKYQQQDTQATKRRVRNVATLTGRTNGASCASRKARGREAEPQGRRDQRRTGGGAPTIATATATAIERHTKLVAPLSHHTKGDMQHRKKQSASDGSSQKAMTSRKSRRSNF